MDFNETELRVLLQALYRYRGEVSGFSQSEQNKLSLVEAVIGRIEGKVGPRSAGKTRFDREMEENLAVLKTGRAGAAKGRAKTANEAESPPAKKAVAAKGSKTTGTTKKAASAGAKKAAQGATAAKPKTAAKKTTGTSKTGKTK